jgi:hypothetical protein
VLYNKAPSAAVKAAHWYRCRLSGSSNVALFMIRCARFEDGAFDERRWVRCLDSGKPHKK